MNTREEIMTALEDSWVSLSDTLDMNIYISSDGKVRFSIYTVLDGTTNIQFAIATGVVEMNYEENK